MEHPLIDFKPIIAPLIPSKRTKGLLVGEYLVVSYATTNLSKPSYAIYNVAGRRLFKASYKTTEDAIEMAEWINEQYEDYLPIWEDYPDADVFGLARWSIKNGLKIYETLKEK